MITRKGISASPGVAIGPALVLDTEEYRIPRRVVEAGEIADQLQLLDNALSAAAQEMSELRTATARKYGAQTAEIFAFHEKFIADPLLRETVAKLMSEQHYTAAYALGQEMNRRQKVFRAVADPYLKDRVRDLYDIEKRILRHILGRAREDLAKLTEPVVLVAHDITPGQAVTFGENILAIATNVGGQTSHLAIIARMLDIPAVVALSDVTSDVAGGETIIVDGTHGLVVGNPDAETIRRYVGKREDYQKFVLQLAGLRDLPAVTRDNVAINLHANIELAEEVETALDMGAQGIGLYRTEFLFLSSARLPTEQEQYEAFAGAVQKLGARPLVIRTIDLGADKLLPNTVQLDANPDLGLRSIRFCLQHLDMYRTHLRAILRASAHGDIRIMFPMITTLLELRQAKSTLADVMEDLEEDGVPFRRDIPVGIMVETPAAALMSASLARDVSFISIGTNDLTQYTLACDRANQRVAYLYAPHNPAVLKLIRETARSADRASVAVSLCGEMAGEPIYCQLLLGLGLRTLSMAPQDIPKVKKIIRLTSIARCEAIARKVLRFDADRQVWNFLRERLDEVDPEALA